MLVDIIRSFREKDTRRLGQRLQNLHSIVMGPVSERHAQAAVLAHLPALAPNVADVEVLLSQVDRIGTTSGEYWKAIGDARAQGKLKEPVDDYLRLIETDFVVRARSGNQVFLAAVEISTTVDNKDVERVLKSASLATKVFGPTAVPLVSGLSIRPTTLLYAEREGVAFIRVEPEEVDPEESDNQEVGRASPH